MTIKKDTQDNLCIGIVVNHLTYQQLELLSAYLDQLPKSLEIVLIGYLVAIPAVFHQVPKMYKVEENSYAVMKKVLFWSIGAFNRSVIPYLFKAAHPLHVLDKLPQMDHLIGQGLGHAIFARKWKDKWIGSLRSWIESYGEDDLIQ